MRVRLLEIAGRVLVLIISAALPRSQRRCPQDTLAKCPPTPTKKELPHERDYAGPAADCRQRGKNQCDIETFGSRWRIDRAIAF